MKNHRRSAQTVGGFTFAANAKKINLHTQIYPHIFLLYEKYDKI